MSAPGSAEPNPDADPGPSDAGEQTPAQRRKAKPPVLGNGAHAVEAGGCEGRSRELACFVSAARHLRTVERSAR
jgi:hypothetical protein